MLNSPDPLHNNFVRHLNAAAPNLAIAVVTDDESIKSICVQAGDVGLNVTCYDRPIISDEELVITYSRTRAAEWQFYVGLQKYYKEGRIVVFGGPTRGLFYEHPNWRSVDLTIAGMFSIAGDYLSFLKRSGSAPCNYVEFGVFDGRTVSLAWHTLNTVCDRFVAVDSFAGIQGSELDCEIYPDGSYYCNKNSFYYNMNTSGVDLSRLDVISADITSEKWAPSFGGRKNIAICHIDTDTYEAASAALNLVRDHLIDGALILFDEYHAHGADPRRGERRALAEWLEANPNVEVERFRDYTAVSRCFIFRNRIR